MRAAAPIVKWVGGKTKLLPELLARMPGKYNRYFEPFIGGAALFFALAPRDAVLGDMNEALIETYRGVATRVEYVVQRLREHKEKHVEPDYYYEVRDAWNAGRYGTSRVERAAAFIYLNKTCYNGLWRVNRSGGFNVPRGAYTDPPICDEDGLRTASKVLFPAGLNVGPYQDTCADACADDFAYFDPPYDPVSKTANFKSYTSDGFGKDAQRQLAEYARALWKRGVHVMLSNSDTPYIRELYADFNVDTVQCARSINSKGSKRGKVNEVVITSYGRTS